MASYRPRKDSRKGLMEDPAFAAVFVTAKARIKEMEFRFVEKADPKRQAFLEIYYSIALSTPLNDFDTH
ncbi:hypothetical protein [Microvirga lotononidis]|uniref:Uncharacterized protein n=1 Tax=Microvirga lotononidis TaxID=864069 RepID=I4Z2K8_9HYPH|nr:hypothetical protein [Microvirga lotononidis]EIM30450.1 hypothetical protein MicloDRAFT_00006990 [Microvirga lotononidis]WQO26292.1 hypothetical protein U0023_16530 [Microvirga lotononidis]